jgi:hypothetical protein
MTGLLCHDPHEGSTTDDVSATTIDEIVIG